MAEVTFAQVRSLRSLLTLRYLGVLMAEATFASLMVPAIGTSAGFAPSSLRSFFRFGTGRLVSVAALLPDVRVP